MGGLPTTIVLETSSARPHSVSNTSGRGITPRLEDAETQLSICRAGKRIAGRAVIQPTHQRKLIEQRSSRQKYTLVHSGKKRVVRVSAETTR